MSSLLGSVKDKNSLTGVSSIEGLSSFSSGSPGMALSTQSLLSSGAKFAPALGSVTMQPSRSFCQLASLYAGCVATVEAIAKSVIAIRIGSKTETARRTLDSVSSSTGVASKVASITQGATGFVEDALTKFKRVPPSSLSTAGAVSAMAATILSPLGGVLSLVKNSLSFFFAGSFAKRWQNVIPKEGSIEQKVQSKAHYLLQTSLAVDPSSIYTALLQKHGDKLALALEKKGEQFLRRLTKKMLKDSPAQDKKKVQEEIKAILNSSDTSKVLSDDLGIGDTQLSATALVGLAVEVEKKRLDKQMTLFSFLSSGASDAVKEALAGGLLERLSSSYLPTQKAAFMQACDLIDKVEKDLKERGYKLLTKIGLGLIGLVASALAIIFTTGAGAVASGILNFSSSIFSYKLDIDDLRDDLKGSMTPAKRDVWFSRAFVVLAVIGVAASAAAVGLLSFGAVPAAFALVGAVVALGFALLSNEKIEMAAIINKKLSAHAIQKLIERRLPSSTAQDTLAPQFIYNLVAKMEEKDLDTFKSQLAKQRGYFDAEEKALRDDDTFLSVSEEDFPLALYLSKKGDEDIKQICLALYKESGDIAYRHLLDALHEGVEDRCSTLDTLLSAEKREILFSSILDFRKKKAKDFVFDKKDMTVEEAMRALQEMVEEQKGSRADVA